VFRVGIIGCGDIAGGYDYGGRQSRDTLTHILAYKKNKMVGPIACADSNAEALERFKEFFNIDHAFESPQRMLEHFKPDIVSICTPPETHETILEICIESRVKGIWCEKPIGLDPNHIERLISAAEAKCIPILVNYMRRYDRLAREIKNLISSEELGKLDRIIFHYSKGLLNNGGHAIDLLLYWLGPLQTFKVLNVRQKIEYDFVTDLYLKADSYQNTDVYLFANEGKTYNFFEFDLLFENGRVRSCENGFGAKLFKVIPNKRFANKYLLSDSGKDLPSSMDSVMGHMLDILIVEVKRGGLNLLNCYDALFNLKLRTKIIETIRGQQ